MEQFEENKIKCPLCRNMQDGSITSLSEAEAQIILDEYCDNVSHYTNEKGNTNFN